MNPVHYRGGAPAMQDRGRRPHAGQRQSGERGHAAHQAGTDPRVLAVTGAKRSQFLPDVPTMKEPGYDVVVESLARRVPAGQDARDVIVAR